MEEEDFELAYTDSYADWLGGVVPGELILGREIEAVLFMLVGRDIPKEVIQQLPLAANLSGSDFNFAAIVKEWNSFPPEYRQKDKNIIPKMLGTIIIKYVDSGFGLGEIKESLNHGLAVRGEQLALRECLGRA